ncbi:MAG: hypothetical protein KDA31_04605 [Phycisphaerales bacterium]|nr:hypothetical protein [Phycisphaerales bacterium]MCB9835698.1 hypothetical protein [Phycisphaera sp.]
MKIARLMTLAACAGLATPALAQDSVSSTGAGDALDAYNTGTQVVKFSTTLTPFTSSLGNTYGIVPLIKASDSLPVDAFLSHLISGQAMSRSIVDNSLTTGAYSTWTMPGQGVNPQNNTAPGSVNAPASGLKSVGVAFAEFGNSANNIISGLVSYDPAVPETLYVNRIVAAVNQPTSTANTDNGAFGMGVVDANMNVMFRADDFNASGSNNLLDDNVFRVNAELRTNGVLNVIGGSGGSHAGTTETLLLSSPTVHSPGTQIEQAIGGPVGFGPNFNGDMAYDDYASTTAAQRTSTFPGLVNSSDHRGTYGYSPINPLGGVATSAFLGRTGASSIYLGVMGLNADASPASVGNFAAPTMIADPIDGYVAPYGEFRHYRSQMAFNGPSGAAAVSQDAVTGEVLAAAVFDIACANCTGVTFGVGGAQAPIQGISVLRFDAADPAGTAEWNLAAWVNGDNGTGKPVFNDSGVQIGELTAIAVFGIAGPSISGVSMDAAGNIYFIAPFYDYGPDMMIGGIDDDFDSALFRGIYDSATGGYTLEKLIQTGDVFASANNGLNYVVTFLSIADSNSTSSGTFFGHNTTFDGFPGKEDPTNPANPGNLGGLVVSADMTYDSNSDGQFDEATGDEGYNYLFYIAPLGGGNITDCNNNGVDDATDIANGTSQDRNADGIPDECPGQMNRLCADVNNDGVVTPADFSAWVSAFNTQNYRADQNFDGLVTPADFSAWVANFNLGVNGPHCLN